MRSLMRPIQQVTTLCHTQLNQMQFSNGKLARHHREGSGRELSDAREALLGWRDISAYHSAHPHLDPSQDRQNQSLTRKSNFLEERLRHGIEDLHLNHILAR